MTEIISCFLILMEIFASLLFCGSMLNQRKWTWISFLSIIAAWLFIFTYTNYFNAPIPAIYVSVFIYLTLSFICYHGPWIRHCVVVLMCILLLAIMDTLILYIGSLLLGIRIDELYAKKHLYLTVATVSKCLSIMITWILWRIQVTKNRSQFRIRWMFLTLLFPTVSLIMLVVVFESFQNGNDVSIRGLMFTLAISLGNVAIMYIIYQLEQAEIESLQNTLLSQQMDVQTKSIIALEKSYRAQRESAHEFNHHLCAINLLLQKGNYSEAAQYIGQLTHQQSTRVLCINSHNPIVDAILNQKYQYASEQGVEMHIKVNDLSNISIPTDSMVVVLSNLLDNAIEACNKCTSDKIIRFSMISSHTIFLSIDNTSPPVSIVDDKIATTKMNKNDHGYGLLNVKRILNDLGAEFAFRYNDGWFSFVTEIPAN